MEFITSRSDQMNIPQDKQGMEKNNWFNMWKRKNFPYNELVVGDILYWFNTKSQKLVWKTKVVEVNRSIYLDKKDIFSQFNDSMDTRYYEKRPDTGYLLHYKVHIIKKLNIPKPKGLKFPQLGWIRLDESKSLVWLGQSLIEDDIILDQFVNQKIKNLYDKLREINRQMQNISPERIERLVEETIRKDTKIVRALKQAANYKCQFPGCGKQIKKKNGGYYIEVAHIISVVKGGQSILGNLIVMCPNHHKEFDFGDLKIHQQTIFSIKGILNKVPFEIDLTNKRKFRYAANRQRTIKAGSGENLKG
jgi:hypothetical protein